LGLFLQGVLHIQEKSFVSHAKLRGIFTLSPDKRAVRHPQKNFGKGIKLEI